MGDPDRGGCWLVLGSVHLLTGLNPPAANHVVVLGIVPTKGSTAPANTVVLRWAELGTIQLRARGIEDQRLHTEAVDGHRLFDGLTPGAALRRLVEACAQPLTRSAYTTAAAPSDVVPLAVVTGNATPGGMELHVHSQIRFHAEDACFLRITETPVRAPSVHDLSWLPAALAEHRRHGPVLNSHDCQYQTCLPGFELEHKYTLPPAVDIWALAARAHRRLSAGQLPGFIPKYRDETQAWDYVNHVFEITGPEHERGYVALIPTADGKHLVKRKWFARDAALRREQHSFGVEIRHDDRRYLRDVLDVAAEPLPPYRRVRYDVNVESTRTGHIFGVLYDRCQLFDTPNEILSQCEIEYTRTRTVLPARVQEMLDELEIVTNWQETFLQEHGVTANRGCQSKLSFLRRAAGRRPGLAS